jgi:hypothetical protein
MANSLATKSDEELVQVLAQTTIAMMGSERAGAAIGELMRRLGVKLIGLNLAIDVLNASSEKLVTETNRLTTRILLLTYVGIGLAFVGVAIGIIQIWKG